MHITYRAVPIFLAAVIFAAGSAMTVQADSTSDESCDTVLASCEIDDSLLTSDLESKLSAAQEVTEEEAEAIIEEQESQALEEEIGSAVSETAVADVDDCVNIRENASEDSEIVGKLYADSIAVVTGSEDGWYQITSGAVTGYIKADYLIVGDADAIAAAEQTIATVTADSLRVRSEASAESEIVTLAAEDTELTVTGEEEDGWISVTTSEGDGYVSADYVEVSSVYKEALTMEEVEALEEEEEENAGSSVVAYASQFLGNPYVYGGSSLTNGTDCSGFVMSVYAHFGISLPHSSYALRSVGVAVDRSDIQPGDIVCYEGHVGIYAGNNTLIHASNERDGIKYTYGIDYRTIVAIRRVL